MAVLRITEIPGSAGQDRRIEVTWEDGRAALRVAGAEFDAVADAGDSERIRWYLEDYAEFPADPAPTLARAAEDRLAKAGRDLFRRVFSSADAAGIWERARDQLSEVRVEVDTDPGAGPGLAWELLRDPDRDAPVALGAGAFVRTHRQAAWHPDLPEPSGDRLRVLLVISRPGGREDVPFRSVASRLVRGGADQMEGLDLDVLRPATYARLAEVLQAAHAAGRPYHVVHFDGHGTYVDIADLGFDPADDNDHFGPRRFGLSGSMRQGRHGYLIFEDPTTVVNQQLVDGPALAHLLRDTGVPVLVLTAGRSAYTEARDQPADSPGVPGGAEAGHEPATAEAGLSADVHARIRAYGSLAAEVADVGVPGVVAMQYNVYVVTAAQFAADLYAHLLAGHSLGQATTAARRALAADPERHIGPVPVALLDWIVPVVYESAPLVLLRPAERAAPLIKLDPMDTGIAAQGLRRGELPRPPDAGFFGRDETLLALDRAFDTQPVVLLHAFAGAGKTSTAAEFARWYQVTGGLDLAEHPDWPGAVLWCSFEHHLTADRVIDAAGDFFAPLLDGSGIAWASVTDPAQRRDIVLQVLAQVPVLWIWDNTESITGFPPGTHSDWTLAEQDDLRSVLHELAARTRCKVLLTSRHDERAWLGDLPGRVQLPAMPMRESLQLAAALAARHGRDISGADWRPLLRYAAGSPLTITVLVSQALREGLSSTTDIEGFVSRIRAGEIELDVGDDATLGRSRSLGASLSYGFAQAFTGEERAQLAVLHLFRDSANADVLLAMGMPGGGAEAAVPQLANLTRESCIALLDRAADIGLLTSLGRDSGYYQIHPALPWYFTSLFTATYGQPDDRDAVLATRAYARAIAQLGDYYHDQYSAGHTESAIATLTLEEANLHHALELARQYRRWSDVIGCTQGLRILLERTGRSAEWARLVADLVPELADPATDGPRPGTEAEWAILTGYRVRLARAERDWPVAQRLQEALATVNRQRAADALAQDPATLDPQQRAVIRSLAVSLEGLGHILREQGLPACFDYYLQAAEHYRHVGAGHEEATVAFNLGHVFLTIAQLRDLDRAEQWYRRGLDLTSDHDRIGRAQILSQLGMVARQRYLDARRARESDSMLVERLSDALRAYHDALQLIPADDTDDLAICHNSLGNVYSEAGEIQQALHHYQQSIQYEEARGNVYGAGRTRYNVALLLQRAGRLGDALQYARAAHNDYERVGFGAAADRDTVSEFISELESFADMPGEAAKVRIRRQPSLVSAGRRRTDPDWRILTDQVDGSEFADDRQMADLPHQRETPAVAREQASFRADVEVRSLRISSEVLVPGGAGTAIGGPPRDYGADSVEPPDRGVVALRSTRLRVLANMRLGSRVAEDERELAAYFVETTQWRRVWRGEIDVIYGQKGSGKSAIYATLINRANELLDRNIFLAAAEDPREARAFQALAADPPATEMQFVALWKLYFLALIADTIEDIPGESPDARKLTRILDESGVRPAGKHSLRHHMRAAREYIRRFTHPTQLSPTINIDPATGTITGFSAAISFEPASATAGPSQGVEVDDVFEIADSAIADAGAKVWILVDRLDVAFEDDRGLERNALRALFKVYRDVQRFDNIALKIFLRTDIWNEITRTGFREASHITRETTLRWTSSALLQLIIRRLVQNEDLVDLFGLTDLDELLSDAEAQKRLFESIFPAHTISGKLRIPTFEWCMKQLSDGSGSCAPRELIHLLGEALEIQVARLEVGEHDNADGKLVDQTCLWQALDQVSKDRLTKTLYAEYPEERQYIEALEGGQVQPDIESLCSRWNQEPPKAREIAVRLMEIGLFDHAYPNADSYSISAIYHSALRIRSD